MRESMSLYLIGIIKALSIVGKITNYKKKERSNMSFLGRQSTKESIKLFSILEDKDYSWRTMNALTTGTGFTEDRIKELIELENKDFKQIVSKESDNGEVLYASTIHLIKKALESPEYVWRTTDGLMKDTPLTSDQIQSVLEQLTTSGELVTATSEVDGKILFTTRKHYQEKENPWNKLLSSLSGSIRTK